MARFAIGDRVHTVDLKWQDEWELEDFNDLRDLHERRKSQWCYAGCKTIAEIRGWAGDELYVFTDDGGGYEEHTFATQAEAMAWLAAKRAAEGK